MSTAYRKCLVAACVILLTSILSLCQQSPEPSERYVPPEFHPSDSAVQALLDSASKAMSEGSYSERTDLLQIKPWRVAVRMAL